MNAAPEEVCDNCGNQAAQAMLISNTAPISGILKDYVSAGQLADLTAPNVKPFLIKNLKWKIVSVSDATLPSIGSLLMCVCRRMLVW